MKALAQNTLIQNRYLVVHLIGKGGMGEVYLAVDQRLGSAVALKRTFFAGDEMLGNAFEREARTLARMRHPVLPKVSDHFGEGDEQYLVMEHIAGDDLAKRLEAAQKPFPVSWVMFWADQLLDALSYLHSHEPPIIHRDIKPQNLKLTDENHIILLDFGLSKTSTGQTHLSNSGSTGSVVGYTPHYAPMEQIRGIGTNPRSDIYSLSATLYQLVTNVVPADALTRADAMLNGMADPIEPPHTLNPEIPPTVSEVILKGMEVSQEKRFANAREMQKALRRAFSQMQEAMSAQTVAFNLGDALPADPASVSAVEKTRIMPPAPLGAPPAAEEPPPPMVPDAGIDFDATLAFDPVENLAQAGIKTEVLPQPSVPRNGDVSGGATNDAHSLSENDRDSVVTVIAGTPRSDDRPPAVNEPAAQPAVTAQPARAVHSAKKSSGRAVAIVGGLAAVLVLALGAAGAGWYFYTNYYAGAIAVQPTPSPAVTPAESTEPPSNSAAVVDTTTSADPPVEAPSAPAATNPTVVSEPNTVPADDRPRTEGDVQQPRQTSTSPRANRATTAPSTRQTPKPKANPGRTDILQ